MSKIIVIGGINMDIVSQVKRRPKPGETVKSKDFLYVPGGKGSNQAMAAHRLGGKVSMLGKVGKDAFGEALLQFFKQEGFDTTSILTTDRVPTGAAFVAVDESSENVIYMSGGANDDLHSEDANSISIEPSDIVSATLETPIIAIKKAFEKAKAIGATTVLNAAPPLLEGKELFPLTDYLIVNETELALFAGTHDISSKEAAISSMQKLKSDLSLTIITTLGAQGTVALIGDDASEIEGYKVNAVDTTAAGDCFVGAFITALQENKSIPEALTFGNAAAAISVQRIGASSSLPMRNEVENFIAQQ